MTPNVRIDRILETTLPMFGLDEFFANYDPAVHPVVTLGPDEYDAAAAKIVLSSSSYLVRVPGLVLVVDTGVGNSRDRLRPMFRQMDTDWYEQLTALIDPDDVDVVVSTHLHMDHVGWNTRLDGGQWIPTFPRARYLFNRLEIDALGDDSVTQSLARNGDFVADSITPVFDAGLAEVFDAPLELTAHLRLEPGPGDTAGHVVVRLVDEGRTVALITGDVFHHALQFEDPALTSRFSSLPDEAVATRKRVFAESADSGVPLLAGHIAAHPALYLEREGDRFRVMG
ncbi:MBL fold metallo-hydrolase [Herbiconiux ginsengi]|uniref:MBL fold metallo-hydrolase n=1 Tax=Herbiconiux ginsengi TaxID=381665 RepID=UPI001114E2EA|nr:MBL fold metallo-hydrolase [Herbiconiux ginsengi]